MNKRDARGLADLDLPREATIDPFTRRALIVKHVEDGWRVYSVGENLVDDGGRFEGIFWDIKDYGLGPLGR